MGGYSVIEYKFKIRAKTPMRFGGSDKIEIVKDSDGKPFVMGNSIGGAIRSYLETDIKKDDLFLFMGGEKPEYENAKGGKNDGKNDEEKKKTVFVKSGVYISDAKISNGETSEGNKGSDESENGGNERESECEISVKTREGTRIDSETGSARENSKYEFEYIDKGAVLEFSIEAEVPAHAQGGKCESAREDRPGGIKTKALEESQMDTVIRSIAKGIEIGRLIMGGQKNNSFGRFKLEHIEKKVWELASCEAIEDYISNREDSAQCLDFESGKGDFNKAAEAERTVIEMDGDFPFGVYQSYRIEKFGQDVSGILENKLPASSLKGVLRHNVSAMIKAMGAKNPDLKEMQIFGGNYAVPEGEAGKSGEAGVHAGKVCCYDIELWGEEGEGSKASEIKVIRPEPGKSQAKGEEDSSKYEKDSKEKMARSEWERTCPTYIKIDRLTGGNSNGALVKQVEMSGKAKLKVELLGEDAPKFIFPVIYTLRRIGTGELPLGGKTSIGLGVFKAKSVKVNGQEIDILKDNVEGPAMKTMKGYYEEFEGWCSR